MTTFSLSVSLSLYHPSQLHCIAVFAAFLFLLSSAGCKIRERLIPDIGQQHRSPKDAASLMLSCVHPNLFVLFKKLFGAAPAGDSESEADMYNNFGPQWPFVRQRHPASAQGLDQKVRAERITIEGDVLR